ncbi:MAG TPA: hypothetical protein PK358_17110 [Spirochaetota bacterium]|nr:hypothetical protein [Spirochaetota bacterium]HPJ36561.1 hypothetical protein [Spirochaetota bacterium]
MNDIEIIYFTDNKENDSFTAKLIKGGLNLRVADIDTAESSDYSEGCILVFDITGVPPFDLLKKISGIKWMEDNIKLILADPAGISGESVYAIKVNNFDFIDRPVEPRSFSLLLEKTVLVEKYRRMMNLISQESSSRIEVFEYLLSMKRADDSDVAAEKNMFLRILDFEKRLMQEQLNLNESIRNIALFRKSEFLAMKDRIKAEEMLGELRRKELLDANNIISAQEGLIDFSSKQLHEAKKIIDAREHVEELSRTEAMNLHEEIKKLKSLNAGLEEKVSRLTEENEKLKKQKTAR